MYLSKLSLYSGFPGKMLAKDFGSFYSMHQTLWRAFPQPPGRVMFRAERDHVLVQSDLQPDWKFLDSIPCYADSVQVKNFDLEFVEGQVLLFRLRANPKKNVYDNNGKKQRLGILGEKECLDWLKYKGEIGGFSLLEVMMTRCGAIWKVEKPKKITLAVAQFDGYLKVTDPQLFAQTIQHGLGGGKSFGVGLISVASAEG